MRAKPFHADDRQDAAAVELGGDRTYSVRAVVRVCRILDLLQTSTTGVSLGQVVNATALPKTSAYRYLWTLERHGYVERDDATSTYRLGASFAGMYSHQLELLSQRSRPWIERLRDELGETVNLGVLEGNHVTYLHVSESSRSVRLAARRGDREPIHSTALGKVLAARMPEEHVRRILQQEGMVRQTANTITDVDDFLDELRRVRRLRVAVDNGENEIDGRCVAVAIAGVPAQAALSVSAPASRFLLGQVEAVAERLRDTAIRIEEEFVALAGGARPRTPAPLPASSVGP